MLLVTSLRYFDKTNITVQYTCDQHLKRKIICKILNGGRFSSRVQTQFE